MILLIDNYDSFVHNLARYFVRLGQETRVVRNDAIRIDEIRALRPRAIVISPGPCTPAEAGCSVEVVREFHQEIPLFGVCLGHQAIAAALGGKVVRAPEPMHGRTSFIEHESRGIFAGLPQPLEVCRYHSLVVEEASLPEEFEVTARTPGGIVMALAHRRWPVQSVQFHPESVLTQAGFPLLANFLKLAGLEVPAALPTRRDECAEPATIDQAAPRVPITF